jgi:hypothetical protein
VATLDVLDTVVRGRVGPGCQITRLELDRDRVGPLTAVIVRAQLEVTKQFVVYKATGGPPRSFSLPGLDPAPVVWSVAETGMTTALARTLDTASLARLDLERASEALCLHILADFAADRGFTQTPRRLRALAGGLGVNALLLAPTAQEADQGISTEMRMTSSWFGLLHEAGHVLWFTDLRHRVLTDRELDTQIRAASAEHPQARHRKPLDLDHLHQEICADVACVNWLWSTTKTMMPIWTGNDANAIRFVLAVAATFCAFAIVNLCGQVADDCASTDGFADQIAAEEDQFALRVGFQVRLTIAIDLATRLAVQDLGEEVQSALPMPLSHLRRRFDEMLTGFEYARHEAYNPSAAPTRRDDPSGRDASPGLSRRGPRPGLLQPWFRAARAHRRDR